MEPFPQERLKQARQCVGALLTKRSLELHSEAGQLKISVAGMQRLAENRLKGYAEQIRKELHEAGVAELNSPKAEKPTGGARFSSLGWTHVGIDASCLRDLGPTAEALRPFGLSVDQRYLDAMDRLERTVTPLAAILVFVVAVAGGVVLLNLILTMWQRVQQNKYQIGILKAAGMRSRHLLAIFAGQALVLGLFAASLGIVLGTFLGRSVSAHAAEGWFSFTIAMGIWILFGATALTVIAGLAGTLWITRLRPIQALVR